MSVDATRGCGGKAWSPSPAASVADSEGALEASETGTERTEVQDSHDTDHTIVTSQKSIKAKVVTGCT